MKLEGKVAVITGAARGQGRSHALTFAREGADIVASDICHDLPCPNYSLGTREELDNTVEEVRALGRRAIAVEADVRNAAQMKAMVDKAIGEFRKIDILINNAGFLHCSPPHEITEEQWDISFDTMVKGVWLGCKYVIPHMMQQKSGVILNTAAEGGLKGFGMMCHYIAAKHAVVGLTRALAVELAPYNIRVNCVCPGYVDTAMLDGVAADLNMKPEELKNRLKKAILLSAPSIMEPQDISNAYLWLASDEARYVTGVALLVDQGFFQKSRVD